MAMENISETLFGNSESKDNSAGKEENHRGGREASMTTQSTATNNYREAVREAAATPARFPAQAP